MMNQKGHFFITCMAYLTLGQFLGNAIFLARTWYFDPGMLGKSLGFASHGVLVKSGCNVESRANDALLPSGTNFRGSNGNSRRFLDKEVGNVKLRLCV